MTKGVGGRSDISSPRPDLHFAWTYPSRFAPRIFPSLPFNTTTFCIVAFPHPSRRHCIISPWRTSKLVMIWHDHMQTKCLDLECHRRRLASPRLASTRRTGGFFCRQTGLLVTHALLHRKHMPLLHRTISYRAGSVKNRTVPYRKSSCTRVPCTRMHIWHVLLAG